MIGRDKFVATIMFVALSLLASSTAQAGSVAILTGSFYTSNLTNDLTAAGESVTEMSTYTAGSLAPFNAVIVYGNMNLLDQGALDAYVTGGGTLIETPWFWENYTPTATEDIFSHGGGADFSILYPGVNVLAPGDPLLTGVTFPGAGGFNIGRTSGNTFLGGVTQVANWADGTAMIGYKTAGAGLVIGINMHVITSDTAFAVIDQPWATNLFVNAAGGTAATPEPSTVLFTGTGMIALLAVFRRRVFQ
jgi:hypothetical protein